jgi:hypothetical protein
MIRGVGSGRTGEILTVIVCDTTCTVGVAAVKIVVHETASGVEVGVAAVKIVVHETASGV